MRIVTDDSPYRRHVRMGFLDTKKKEKVNKTETKAGLS
ncbi:unnamed protein product [Chondrus crispus]|uniref:Uncharacterized protein n=1 Tax=Chondrus crispus TaxID=2769 RepID=R7Q5P7_CHOCR|nr:unnamed protein product [Chondrus crispus]CDF32790.1 unnamed protein product [Chondrus crispus]|eukprot:XP_005712591.1 unnamed protein product [Chondrus crispus]